MLLAGCDANIQGLDIKTEAGSEDNSDADSSASLKDEISLINRWAAGGGDRIVVRITSYGFARTANPTSDDSIYIKLTDIEQEGYLNLFSDMAAVPPLPTEVTACADPTELKVKRHSFYDGPTIRSIWNCPEPSPSDSVLYSFKNGIDSLFALRRHILSANGY